jgi:hypothetical protein
MQCSDAAAAGNDPPLDCSDPVISSRPLIRMNQLRLLLPVFLGLLLQSVALAELTSPAFTAYVEPKADGARVSERSGITRWTDPAQHVSWFGELQETGKVTCSVSLRLPAELRSKLRLTVGGKSQEVEITGNETNLITASFGSFHIVAPGYQRFLLQSLNESGKPAGDIQALVLDGSAITNAHFNLKPRRNAASVHLAYPAPENTRVEAFYCEMTAVDDPVWSYYMACGWHRGYFGMQVNSATERRIIFSVWDSGKEAVDRGKVAAEDRVTLMGKGDGVYSGDFGNEGTGGHSHLKYPWKTGEKQRFVVTAKPVDETHTIYSGYYFHPDSRKWMLISSWRAPKDGSWLRGLHSFSENFVGDNGQLRRKALYGNQWIRSSAGTWLELTKATFSHDATGKADRRDRFMGVENGQFFLSHGGFVPGFTRFGEPFTRPASGRAPEDFLPKVGD